MPVTLESRTFETELIILPEARSNRTLMGVDFLKKANIVLAISNKTCDGKDYSITEREALVVVWALQGRWEITTAIDYQQLKWLMNLKSPSERLALVVFENPILQFKY
ncbi:hypothetical protein CEXT_486111 [Caerostris extrusa]|uniref:Uncharacterized protein n=1 Tax=Caerostris extrusa TaxID=172846 RepID=A0AAV4N275_CAEEX|nr:hypothetical protein CEXT_486111 [Caerostris extrusa]